MSKKFIMGFPIGQETVYIAVVSRKKEVYSDYSEMAKKLLLCDLMGDFVCLDSSTLDNSFTTNTKVVSILLFLVAEDITLKPYSVKLIF